MKTIKVISIVTLVVTVAALGVGVYNIVKARQEEDVEEFTPRKELSE